MKKIFLIGMLAALATGAYGQGLINLGNIENSNTNWMATSGGLFWLEVNLGGGVGGTLDLINEDFSVNFFGGSDANSLVLLKSFVNSGGGAAGGPGTFLDLSGSAVAIPGALTTGYFQIEAWLERGACRWGGKSAVFSNPLGNPFASPPGVPTTLTEMPAVFIVCIPEPSTFALASLGAVALLMFRRRE